MSQTQGPHRDEANEARPPSAPPRKRVVARELAPERAAATDVSQALEGPLVRVQPTADAVDAGQALSVAEGLRASERQEPDPTPVVDPTLLGRRHRRHAHHRVYRWTQALTMLCAGAAGASIICTMVDEPFAGRIVAGAGVLAGLAAVILSGRTSLSMRWRGWAVAALVFAGAALALTWIHAVVTENEREGAPVPAVKRSGAG